jgi:hypothetical protein
MLREGTGGRGRVKEVNVVDVLFYTSMNMEH